VDLLRTDVVDTVVSAFDADGRPVRSAAQVGTQWLVSCRSYTPTGKLLKAWGPALTASDTTCPTAAAPVPVTDIVYDDLDRPVNSIQNLSVAEGGNRITGTAYNLDDSVNNVQRAVSSAVAQTYASYSYTDNGLLATQRDAKSNLTGYQYDGHDRRIKTSCPNPGTPNSASANSADQVVSTGGFVDTGRTAILKGHTYEVYNQGNYVQMLIDQTISRSAVLGV
jgi:YD repeat-containing protein